MVVDPPPPPPPPIEECEAVSRSLPIPFEYTVEADHLAVVTEVGSVPVLIGPWGAHAPPHTGHPEGNVKSDWTGLWTPRRDSSELVEVAYVTGDVSAGCPNDGSRCGLSRSYLESHIPFYRFPDDEVRVIGVQFLGQSSDNPYDGKSWAIGVELCPYRYILDHVGGISDELVAAVILELGEDPFDSPAIGPNLIEGFSVTMPANTDLGRPHIKAYDIAENADYVTGPGGVFGGVPHAQIEWTAVHMAESVDGYARPEYDYMDAALVVQLEAMLDLQAVKYEDSFRYADTETWQWMSEHVLVATEPFHREESTGLTSGIGGWWQRPETDVCDPAPFADPACAETFSIFPIHDQGTFYDAALYASSEVNYLAYRGTSVGGAWDFYSFGEVISPATPDPTSGTLYIHWRGPLVDDYQVVSYRFDPMSERMRFRYGPLEDAAMVVDPLALPAPAVPDIGDACTNDTLICMTSQTYGRF